MAEYVAAYATIALIALFVSVFGFVAFGINTWSFVFLILSMVSGIYAIFIWLRI